MMKILQNAYWQKVRNYRIAAITSGATPPVYLHFYISDEGYSLGSQYTLFRAEYAPETGWSCTVPFSTPTQAGTTSIRIVNPSSAMPYYSVYGDLYYTGEDIQLAHFPGLYGYFGMDAGAIGSFCRVYLAPVTPYAEEVSEAGEELTFARYRTSQIAAEAIPFFLQRADGVRAQFPGNGYFNGWVGTMSGDIELGAIQLAEADADGYSFQLVRPFIISGYAATGTFYLWIPIGANTASISAEAGSEQAHAFPLAGAQVRVNGAWKQIKSTDKFYHNNQWHTIGEN